MTSTVSGFWDSQAVRYERAYGSPTRLGHFLRSRRDAVVDHLGDGPGEVLDVGMGPGFALAELTNRGWRVSGVDVSERMVALARARVPEARERLVQAPLEGIPFPDARFDAVVATGVLGDAGWTEETLAALANALRPGGRAVLSLPNRWSPSRTWRNVLVRPLERGVRRIRRTPGSLHRARPPARRRFEEMLEAAGLSVESLRHASPSLGPLATWSPRAGARVSRRLQRGGALGTVLAGQLVYCARKRSR
jgi:SAM-dependent methyltransferase